MSTFKKYVSMLVSWKYHSLSLLSFHIMWSTGDFKSSYSTRLNPRVMLFHWWLKKPKHRYVNWTAFVIDSIMVIPTPVALVE